MSVTDIPRDIFSVLFRWVFPGEDFVDSRVRCHDAFSVVSALRIGRFVETMMVVVFVSSVVTKMEYSSA